MGNVNLSKREQKIFIAVIALALLAIGLTLFGTLGWMILTIAGIVASTSPPSMVLLLQLFAVIIAVLCSALWFAAILQVINLDEKTKSAIGKSIIVASLAVVATAIGRSLGVG